MYDEYIMMDVYHFMKWNISRYGQLQAQTEPKYFFSYTQFQYVTLNPHPHYNQDIWKKKSKEIQRLKKKFDFFDKEDV